MYEMANMEKEDEAWEIINDGFEMAWEWIIADKTNAENMRE